MNSTETEILGALQELERAASNEQGPSPSPVRQILDRLDRLTHSLPEECPAQLRHFLERKSYEKARLFLLSRRPEESRTAGSA